MDTTYGSYTDTGDGPAALILDVICPATDVPAPRRFQA